MSNYPTHSDDEMDVMDAPVDENSDGEELEDEGDKEADEEEEEEESEDEAY